MHHTAAAALYHGDVCFSFSLWNRLNFYISKSGYVGCCLAYVTVVNPITCPVSLHCGVEIWSLSIEMEDFLCKRRPKELNSEYIIRVSDCGGRYNQDKSVKHAVADTSKMLAIRQQCGCLAGRGAPPPPGVERRRHRRSVSPLPAGRPPPSIIQRWLASY